MVDGCDKKFKHPKSLPRHIRSKHATHKADVMPFEQRLLPEPMQQQQQGGIWQDFTREAFVRAFLAKTVSGIKLEDDKAEPIIMLVKQSERAYAIDGNYYAALMASLEVVDVKHRSIDSLLLCGLLEFLQGQWTEFTWNQLVIAFTWASLIQARFAHLHSEVQQFCEQYVDCNEAAMQRLGGWQGFMNFALDKTMRTINN